MLDADYLDTLSTPIVKLYDDYAQTVINDIARRLAKMGRITDTAAWQMQRLIESGRIYENAIAELAKVTGLRESELKRLFKDAGVKSLRFDDDIYRRAGLNPLPLNLSPAMAATLSAGLQKTNGLIQNLTMTTASNAQQAFISAADMAYMQVSAGAMSYDQAIRAAIKSVGESGLLVTYPTGHTDKLDVAMRRATLTGVTQTAGKLQENRADEMGQDLVQVSAHLGARPAHAVWQGKIFSRSGTSKRYPDFVQSTGYGTGAGLGGWNCRHSWYPFFEGISENAYTAQDRQGLARKTIKLGDKEISIYDATQIQREIERKIRYWKRQEQALKAGGLTTVKETSKVAEYQAKMRAFISEMNKQDEFIWYRQRVREKI